MTKVLIVDDKSENLYLLESLLTGHGFKTVSATNGAEALGLALLDPPDLIISDILMPVMDGYSLCREWKKDEKLKNVPFVFYTATYTHPKDEEFAMNIGADLFMIKPQEPDVFMENIGQVLNDFSAKKLSIRNTVEMSELAVYKEYNETLIRKMEDRMLQSEAAEKKIRDYAAQLELEIEQRKVAAQALKDSEEKYRAIFENSSVAILLTSTDGNIYSANSNACKMFGKPEEEICKFGRNGIVDISDPRLPILLEERKKNGKAKGEITLIRKDGTKFQGEVSSVVFIDGNGNERTSMVIIDLTEKIKAEKDLKESKQLFQNLAEISPVGIFRTSADGLTTYVNPKWKELSGLGFGEALGIGWINAVHPDDKESLVINWNKNLELKQVSQFEYRFLKPDGGIVWVIGNAVPELNDEKIVGYIGTITDITEQKYTEIALRKSETRLRSYFDLSIAGIAITSPSKGWIEVNDHLCDMLGYPKEELYNTTWVELTHPDDITNDLENFDLVIAGKIEGYSMDKRFICKNGDFIWVSMSVKCIRLANGEIDYFVALMFDITDRKKAEEELLTLKDKLEERVQEQTYELEVKIKELEEFKAITIDREFRIMELREEIKRLKGNKL